VVHGVEMCGGGREEREKRWTVRRKWVEAEKRKERKEIRGKAAPSCLSLYLAQAYVKIKKSLTPMDISLHLFIASLS
jgi:hypothetical protein